MKSEAERKREIRERARAEGLCIVNPAHGIVPDGRATCVECRAQAYERVKAARAAAKRRRKAARRPKR